MYTIKFNSPFLDTHHTYISTKHYRMMHFLCIYCRLELMMGVHPFCLYNFDQFLDLSHTHLLHFQTYYFDHDNPQAPPHIHTVDAKGTVQIHHQYPRLIIFLSRPKINTHYCKHLISVFAARNTWFTYLKVEKGHSKRKIIDYDHC